MLPETRVLWHGIGQGTISVLDPALGFEAQRNSVAGAEGEQAQHDHRVARSGGLLQINPAVHHGKSSLETRERQC